jgi:hypothetical protein
MIRLSAINEVIVMKNKNIDSIFFMISSPFLIYFVLNTPYTDNLAEIIVRNPEY